MTDADKAFWSSQTSSLHRNEDADFYARKADEHAGLLSPAEREAGCVDLGCGAGELLVHFARHVNVRCGVDYSQSMLDAAAVRLKDYDVELRNADIFEFLPASRFPVWTTTGAINQYLAPPDMGAFLDIFRANETATSMYLYDCVDPLRYRMISYGIAYRDLPQPAGGSALKQALRPLARAVRRARLGGAFALGQLQQPCWKIPSDGMGYAYQPGFWIEAARARGIGFEIVSSRYYEYRYHVILKKERA